MTDDAKPIEFEQGPNRWRLTCMNAAADLHNPNANHYLVTDGQLRLAGYVPASTLESANAKLQETKALRAAGSAEFCKQRNELTKLRAELEMVGQEHVRVMAERDEAYYRIAEYKASEADWRKQARVANDRIAELEAQAALVKASDSPAWDAGFNACAVVQAEALVALRARIAELEAEHERAMAAAVKTIGGLQEAIADVADGFEQQGKHGLASQLRQFLPADAAPTTDQAPRAKPSPKACKFAESFGLAASLAAARADAEHVHDDSLMGDRLSCGPCHRQRKMGARAEPAGEKHPWVRCRQLGLDDADRCILRDKHEGGHLACGHPCPALSDYCPECKVNGDTPPAPVEAPLTSDDIKLTTVRAVLSYWRHAADLVTASDDVWSQARRYLTAAGALLGDDGTREGYVSRCDCALDLCAMGQLGPAQLPPILSSEVARLDKRIGELERIARGGRNG